MSKLTKQEQDRLIKYPYNCPNCGAELKFDPGEVHYCTSGKKTDPQEMMYCSVCGTSFKVTGSVSTSNLVWE